MAFISLGIYSKSHFLFLFGSLSLILRHFIEIFLNSKLNADPSNKDKPFNEIALPLFKSLLMGLGMSLSFVIELIILPKFKFDDNTISEERKDKLRLFSKEMLFVLLISLLDTVGFVTAFFAKDTESLNAIKTIRYILQFLVALLLTIYILKKQMFKHHFVFTIIVFVGTALVLMSDIFSTNKFHLNILYVCIDGILYGFVMVSAKWIMHYKFISPFTIVSIMGAFTIIVSFISFIIFQQFQNLKEFFQVVTGIQLFMFCIVFIIMSTFYNVFIMMTVKQFGATNLITIDFISLFIIKIIESISKINDDTIEIYILLIIGNLITIFGAVGFNEIVIISCCDINYNTTLEIEKRACICDEIIDLKTVRETIKKSDKDDEFSIEI